MEEGKRTERKGKRGRGEGGEGRDERKEEEERGWTERQRIEGGEGREGGRKQAHGAFALIKHPSRYHPPRYKMVTIPKHRRTPHSLSLRAPRELHVLASPQAPGNESF